jgi:hypothetical protein
MGLGGWCEGMWRISPRAHDFPFHERTYLYGRCVLLGSGRDGSKSMGTAKMTKRKKTSGVLPGKYGLTLEEWRAIQERHGSKPFTAFRSQKRMALLREIEWSLTFAEWWSVWTKSSLWEERGRGKANYVMARPGDVGPYSLENVVISRAATNNSDGGIKSGLLRIARVRVSDEALLAALEACSGRACHALLSVGLSPTGDNIGRLRKLGYVPIDSRILGAEAVHSRRNRRQL